jgi:hypothetical protein
VQPQCGPRNFLSKIRALRPSEPRLRLEALEVRAETKGSFSGEWTSYYLMEETLLEGFRETGLEGAVTKTSPVMVEPWALQSPIRHLFWTFLQGLLWR